MKKNFTLAEVLITIGIIGVVAALTIPALMTKINDSVCKVRWKKAYADLNKSFQLAKEELDMSNYIGCNTNYCKRGLAYNVIERFSMRGARILDTTQTKGYPYQSYNGEKWNYSSMLLVRYDVNGMSLYIWDYYPWGFTLWVDVNGVGRGPNTVGKDFFAITFFQDSIAPVVENSISECAIPERKKNFVYYHPNAAYGTYYGVGCSAKYIYER